MSSNPPLCSPPNGDSSSQTTDDAVLAAKVDEAIGDDAALAAEVDEVLEAESKPEGTGMTGAPAAHEDAAELVGSEAALKIDKSRRLELMRGFKHQVRYGVFDAFPDPRCNIESFTAEALTRVLPKLPAEINDRDAFEAVMDAAVQLATDARPQFEGLRGVSRTQLFSLQTLYGFKLKKEDSELRSLLVAIDSMPDDEEAVVFQMIAHCGWTNKKTAQVLGISKGQVSKIMKRAKKKLTATVGTSVEELMESFFGDDIARRNQKS
ncbi:sigma factor-like helix-turn-helix DNA-binding protein [Streptomyces sp. NPDC051014]|uniref:sigma factor-like helix-turn-helix DNA-binding protein n=1 Tax=Streptomyces sp. NPDC051014 TaxID=3155751 RepID=UPI0033EA9EFD